MYSPRSSRRGNVISGESKKWKQQSNLKFSSKKTDSTSFTCLLILTLPDNACFVIPLLCEIRNSCSDTERPIRV